jgi:hypothetical protein
MAFDAARQKTVLFGGADHFGALGDTWTWDGTNWTKEAPATSPPAATNFAMVWDGGIRRIMAFMGLGLDQVPWAWDGSTWQRMTVSRVPGQRELEAFAYDSVRQQTVMFGGEYVECPPLCGDLDDTWTLSRQGPFIRDWRSLFPLANPGQVSRAAMAFDATRRLSVLFGGERDGICCIDETWAWHVGSWGRLFPSNAPTAREQMAMSWDGVRHQIVLFGGKDVNAGYLGDTWTWDGVTWTEH